MTSLPHGVGAPDRERDLLRQEVLPKHWEFYSCGTSALGATSNLVHAPNAQQLVMAPINPPRHRVVADKVRVQALGVVGTPTMEVAIFRYEWDTKLFRRIPNSYKKYIVQGVGRIELDLNRQLEISPDEGILWSAFLAGNKLTTLSIEGIYLERNVTGSRLFSGLSEMPEVVPLAQLHLSTTVFEAPSIAYLSHRLADVI